MILEAKAATVATTAVLALSVAVFAMLQGVTLSVELLVGIGINFIILLGFGVKLMADGRIARQFQEALKDMPERMARIEEQVGNVDEKIEGLQREIREDRATRHIGAERERREGL